MSRLPATLPSPEDGRTRLLNGHLSSEMGRAVMERLSQIQELPESGLVAGQAVMSVIMELYGANPDHRGPVNDIDIFHTRFDRFLETGLLERAQSSPTPWLETRSVQADDYTATFEQRLNLGEVKNDGMLNLIEVTGSLLNNIHIGRMKREEVLDMLLAEFDISTVQVGVDLSTGEMRWTQGFQDFIEGGLAQTRNIALAERSWLRVERKREAMPWIQWDDQQITSSIHLAQVRNSLMLSTSEKRDALFDAWVSRYGAEIEYRSGRSPEAKSMGVTGRSLEPIWKWGSSPSQTIEQHVAAMVDRRKEGLLFMTPEDVRTAQLMITHMLSSESNRLHQQANAITQGIPTEDPASKYYALLSDPVKLMICAGVPGDFPDYVASHPGCLLEDGMPGQRKIRDDLLVAAVVRDNLPAASLLMEAGVSPNMLYERGTLYSHAMCDRSKDNIELLQKMRDHGADITLTVLNGSTVAHQIMESAPLGFLETEWEKHPESDRMVRDRAGRLPGHHLDLEGHHSERRSAVLQMVPRSAREEYPIRVNSLVGLSVYANQENFKNDAEGRVHWCDHAQLLNALEAGANPNTDAAPGSPALLVVAMNNDVRAVDILMSKGAQVDILDDTSTTPFMAAAKNGAVNAMERLLEHGADLNAEDSMGQTALELAVIHRRGEATSWLISQGADVRRLNPNDGFHPLEYAVVQNNPGVVSTVMNAMPLIEVERIVPGLIEKFKAKAANAARPEYAATNAIAAMEAKIAMIEINKICDSSALIGTSQRPKVG